MIVYNKMAYLWNNVFQVGRLVIDHIQMSIFALNEPPLFERDLRLVKQIKVYLGFDK